MCVAALAALALLSNPLALAPQPGAAFVVPYAGTLKKIRDRGVVRIGHRENSPPFAFLDARGKPACAACSTRRRRRIRGTPTR